VPNCEIDSCLPRRQRQGAQATSEAERFGQAQLYLERYSLAGVVSGGSASDEVNLSIRKANIGSDKSLGC
jgi:hypothetical protein